MTVRLAWMIWAIGCGGEAVQVQPVPATPEVPEVPVATPVPKDPLIELTPFENELLAEHLEDIRAGVRPFSDESLGICRSADKQCDEYLGRDVGPLEAGRYLFLAEMRVPRTGERGTWQVVFDLVCTITKDDGSTSSSTSSKEYTVAYAGEQHGYRLRLRTFESPHQGGERTCDWTITAPHPDGDKVYNGTWVVAGT